ncbi:hypothetical protein BC830DRAFT_1157526 [Chytriomyces sp. MP71]|nr:hypothetical protein BC830DRAFT_1157526 [Chytriomyces sp. MP71]
MGAQSSKAATRRLEPRILAASRLPPIATPSSAPSPSEAATAPTPDSTPAHAALSTNLHQLNWAIKTAETPAHFQKDNEMLAILTTRSKAAAEAHASPFRTPIGRVSAAELEEYLFARKGIPERKRAEFDETAQVSQRLGKQNLDILRAFLNTPDIVAGSKVDGMGDSLQKSKWV